MSYNQTFTTTFYENEVMKIEKWNLSESLYTKYTKLNDIDKKKVQDFFWMQNRNIELDYLPTFYSGVDRDKLFLDKIIEKITKLEKQKYL